MSTHTARTTLGVLKADMDSLTGVPGPARDLANHYLRGLAEWLDLQDRYEDEQLEAYLEKRDIEHAGRDSYHEPPY